MSSIINPLDKLVIKDEFYTNPDDIRLIALNKQYHAPPGDTVRLAKTAECDESETKAMCDVLQPHVKERDIVNVTVVFRYTLAGTQKKAYCHVDGCTYAGIVYLTLPEHCAGGTTIFRHRLTGDEIYNAEHKHLYDYNDESQWEIIQEIDMAYNRLVMYPGQLFHSITPVFFGDDISNSRLTQNVFIYRADDPALGCKNNRF